MRISDWSDFQCNRSVQHLKSHQFEIRNPKSEALDFPDKYLLLKTDSVHEKTDYRWYNFPDFLESRLWYDQLQQPCILMTNAGLFRLVVL